MSTVKMVVLIQTLLIEQMFSGLAAAQEPHLKLIAIFLDHLLIICSGGVRLRRDSVIEESSMLLSIESQSEV